MQQLEQFLDVYLLLPPTENIFSSSFVFFLPVSLFLAWLIISHTQPPVSNTFILKLCPFSFAGIDFRPQHESVGIHKKHFYDVACRKTDTFNFV